MFKILCNGFFVAVTVRYSLTDFIHPETVSLSAFVCGGLADSSAIGIHDNDPRQRGILMTIYTPTKSTQHKG